MRSLFRNICSLGLLILLANCGGNRNVSNRNLSYIYNPDPNVMHPSYVVHHENENSSVVYFRIRSRELLYNKKASDKKYRGEAKLSYSLTEFEDRKQQVDSGSIYLLDMDSVIQNKFLEGKLRFSATFGKRYILFLRFKDMTRDQTVISIVEVDKRDKLNRQNFLVTDHQGNPQFSNFHEKQKPIRIKYNNKMNNKMFVRYYNRKFEYPSPPFSVEGFGAFKFDADSQFTVTPDDSMMIFNPSKKGFYHVQLDTNSREGVTIYSKERDFPSVKTLDGMLHSVRYLTSKQEYNMLQSAEDKKQALDDFWFGIAGNTEKGREIIQKYYQRIEYSNLFFSSYLAGWKTDRGLIYTIYGPPNIIYKDVDVERWIYGEQNNILSIDFTFYKVDNPFTDNDFYLSRSSVYKSSWYRAIDSWRQGRIF